MTFVHLNVRSSYSLCEGAIKIKKIPDLCAQYSFPAVAITDSHNLFGALEFCIACKEKNIQPIIGCTVCIKNKNETFSLILLCQNETGYKNLIHIISESYISNEHYKEVLLDDLIKNNQGLIAITPYENSDIGKLILKKQNPKSTLDLYKSVFKDRFYMGIQRHNTAVQQSIESDYIDQAFKNNIPLVPLNDVYFENQSMYDAHDALLCIANGHYISEDNRPKVTPEHYFKSSEEMKKLFSDLEEAISNTCIIAQRCCFMLTPKAPILPPYKSKLPEKETLKIKAEKGLKSRLQNSAIPKEKQEIYTKRLQYELEVIIKMGFPGYFLIVADFIQWAKEQAIPVGPGRGSGAGSLVAWSLTITNIDPIKYNLIFERFLNPERVSMPDFDIDFCQERRDEVIHYVQKKYGTDKVAHIVTFGTLQARAALRDVGRVLQMPYSQVDQICKLVPNNPAQPISLETALKEEQKLQQNIEDDLQVKKLFNIAIELEGLYRHASTHAAGVVIGNEKLSNIVPLYREPDSNTPSTQFSMKYIELAGLLKFDFLGLKTLTVINHCCKKLSLDIEKIPLNDSKTFKILSEGKTTGIFQFESAGMRDVLINLQPDRFEDLIILNALYRPGPMDDIPTYLARKHGKEEITYLHPKLEPILSETYGVMVYQEQVMQIAQELAGYSFGEADLLRRAMGKKIKSAMEKQEKVFIKGAMENNIPQDIASTLFGLMAKFASYGFNKSHSAPYALVAYQTAYLKANYPEEFFGSLMTFDSHNTDKLKMYFTELKSMGLKLLPPSINHSSHEFTTTKDAIFYSLAAIKNIGENIVKKIVAEREKNGIFKNIADFLFRIGKETINKKQLENLCLSGALDCLHTNRKELFESIEKLIRWNHYTQNQIKTQQQNLFENTPSIDFLTNTAEDWSSDKKLKKEFDTLGFYLTAHPMDSYAPFYKMLELTHSQDISKENNYTIKVAGIVQLFKERTSKNGNKFAFVELSDSDGILDILIFREQIESFKNILTYTEPLLIECQVQQEENSVRLIGMSAQTLQSALEVKPIELKCNINDIKHQKLFTELYKAKDKGKGKTNIIMKCNFENEEITIKIPNLKIDLEQRKKLIEL